MLLLCNAANVKNAPGRKTDVKDAEWLADLMAHGLIRPSFVPDEPTQQMRDLLRARKQFVRERSSHTQRIEKALEDARSNRMKKGAPWLKTTLIQCAWAASHKKNSYLQAQYLRIRSKRGSKKAIGAVAASMLTAAYPLRKDGTLDQDHGASYLDNRDKGKQALRLVNRLQNPGFTVQIASMAA